MKHFKRLTSTAQESKQNVIIMGRKTYESLPTKPLLNRLNIVVSTTLTLLDKNLISVPSLDAALIISHRPNVDKIFVIGGEMLYREAILHPKCESIYASEIQSGCTKFDRFFPPIDPYQYTETESSTFNDFTLKRFKRIKPNTDEQQYLDIIRNVIAAGKVRIDRTGVGTVGTFGCRMAFNLRNNVFPLLTTKRVFFRGVVEELLWMIRGDTNAKSLMDVNVNIWKQNGTREFLDSVGLTENPEYDLGPVYGFQWRHFGGEYKAVSYTHLTLPTTERV